jgi:hypothetical protein
MIVVKLCDNNICYVRLFRSKLKLMDIFNVHELSLKNNNWLLAKFSLYIDEANLLDKFMMIEPKEQF